MRTARLELGCGYRPTPGWTRVDANPEVPDLDYCGDAAGPLPWPDETFAEIRAVDVLEHLPYRLTLAALTEWARLLAPGGRLYIQVPDAGLIMRRYAENPAALRERLPADIADLPPIIGAAWRLLGGQDDGTIAAPHSEGFVRHGDDWRLNAHYALFDEPALRWFVARAGLTVASCESNFHPNLCVWATKP